MLGAQRVTVFAACMADFSKHGAQSSRFSDLALGCVFRARASSLTCAARVSIFGPKIWTPSKNTILSAIIRVRFWRPVARALERFHECFLSGASAKNAARSSHAFKKNEVKQQADMRPRRRGGYYG